ncbi:MAG TPA: hypothetical protein VLK22_01000 [Candidatus Udaeobacter sp.]|nr:hypothetical protein [Candidatus Udaeobacter sp.]
MMKKIRSEYAFEKHKPYTSWKENFFRIFKRKKTINAAPQDKFHYKSNPYRETKKISGTKIKITILIIILVGWMAYLAYASYFKINKINYFGLNITTKDEMDKFIFENYLNKKSFLSLNNYFLVDAAEMEQGLYQKFPFETIKITKVFPNQINIEVKEKISSIIYDNGKKYFLLDSSGMATKFLQDVQPYEVSQKINTSTVISLAALNNTSTQLASTTFEHTPDYKKINKLFGDYPLVYDKRGLEVAEKQEHILPPEQIAAIISWFKTNKQDRVVGIEFFTLDDLYSGISIETASPWKIIFQPANSVDSQINVLKQTLSTIKPKEYIDLRFGEKVYWK